MRVLPGDSKEMRWLIMRYKHDGNGLLFRDDPIARKEPVAQVEEGEADLADVLECEEPLSAEPLSAEEQIDARLAKALEALEGAPKH